MILFDSIRTVLGGVKVKREVMYVGWLEPVWTAGNGTFIDDIILLAGGYNVFHDAQGWIMTNPEEIAERNPR